MENNHRENIRLSEHFTLEEFTRSGTALRLRIDNTPPDKVVDNLQALCQHVLEPLRRRFGVLRITSGYRCDRLNAAVGGSVNSQHRLGQAADLHVSSPEVGRKMFDFITRQLDFDQLLFEHNVKTKTRWLHVSYRASGPANRHEAVADYRVGK